MYTLDVVAGDRIILCSDGLTDMVRERDIERIARSESDPQRAAELLVDAANAAGGVDNITVVVLDVEEVEADAALDPEALLVDADPPPTPVPQVAPDVPAPTPPEPRTPLGRRVRGALLLLIPLLVIIGLAVGAVGWYARRSFYVGTDNNQVVVFRGVPGGVLGWNPTVDQRSALTVERTAPGRPGSRGGRCGPRFPKQGRGLRCAAADPRRLDVHHDHVDHHHDPADHHDAPAPPPDGRAGRARDAGAMTTSVVNRTRRRSEFALGLLVVIVTGGGYILVALSDGPKLPADLWAFLASVLGLYLVAHLAVRRFAPGADATLLPLAAALNGIGFVTISRLDRELARIQAGLGRRRGDRVRGDVAPRPRHASAREVPVHVRACWVSCSCCCRCSRASGARSTARACGRRSAR